MIPCAGFFVILWNLSLKRRFFNWRFGGGRFLANILWNYDNFFEKISPLKDLVKVKIVSVIIWANSYQKCVQKWMYPSKRVSALQFFTNHSKSSQPHNFKVTSQHNIVANYSSELFSRKTFFFSLLLLVQFFLILIFPINHSH